MKHLLLILTIIFMSINLLAKEDEKSKRVSNLNYDITFTESKGTDLNFEACYYVPFKGTKYSQKMFITKEEEFFFWEEAYNLIDLSNEIVEKVYSDELYVLKPFYSNGKKVGSVSIQHEKTKIFAANEIKTGVFCYSGFTYALEEINISKTFLIVPISKSDYEKHMGIISNKEYLYLFIPKKGAKLKIENICGNLTIYSANISVMYPKKLIKNK